MLCDRCYQPTTEGEHGVFLCALKARRRAATVRPDSIPGGLLIEHGLCNADGTPRRYDSHSEITRECAARGLTRWTDVYTEDRTKEGRERADWMQSGEARRARAERQEMRRERAEARR